MSRSSTWPAPNRVVRGPRGQQIAVNVVQPTPMMQAGGSQTGTAPVGDIGSLLRLVRRNLAQIILTVLAGVGLALAYLAVAKPSYTATSAIFVDPRQRKVVNEEVVQQNYGTDIALFESQVSIIGSDAILSRVVKALDLERDAEFVPPTGNDGGLLNIARTMLNGPRAVVDPNTQALDALARKMRVRRAQNTYVVTVDVTSDNAVKAARIANAILAAYLEDQAAAKNASAAEANSKIDGRLDELKNQVRRAETRVDEFKRENKIVTSEGGLLNEQQLTKLNTELVTVKGIVANAKAKLDEMNATLRRGVSPEALPEAMNSPTIQRLREQLATVARREASLSAQLQPRHPVMADVRAQTQSIRAQITSELQRISTQAQNEFQIASSREREIEQTLTRSGLEVAETTTAQIKLREYEREADASREVLRTFLARAKETQEQQNLTIAEARVITPAAVPSRKSSPNTMLALAVATLGGLGLAMARALVASQMAPAAPGGQRLVLDGEAVPLRSFGVLPRLTAGGLIGRAIGRRGSKPTIDDLMTALGDSARADDQVYRAGVQRIAGRLRNLGQSEVPQIALLVSAGHNAGTSYSAFSVAYAQALTGEKALLIDASSANPTLSNLFAADIAQDHPCILDNKDHLAGITSHDPRSGLSFLPIALADLRTLTMNQRQRLANGIAKLALDYDLVVIDGGSLAEDESIAAMVGIASQVIVVARAGAYDEGQSQELVAALGVDHERLAGVLITMGDPKAAD